MLHSALLALAALAACSAAEPSPAAPAAAPAAQPSEAILARLSPAGQEAYLRLLVARRFTDDAIYVGGVTPNEVIALRRLAREEHATAAFDDLELRATLPGRLFALCGLYYADPEAFRARVEPYRASGATVFFQTGCAGLEDQSVADLVERDGPGVVRLTGEQAVKEWAAANRERLEELGGYRYDLVGGGWPNLLLYGGGWHAAQDEEYGPEKG